MTTSVWSILPTDIGGVVDMVIFRCSLRLESYFNGFSTLWRLREAAIKGHFSINLVDKNHLSKFVSDLFTVMKMQKYTTFSSTDENYDEKNNATFVNERKQKENVREGHLPGVETGGEETT